MRKHTIKFELYKESVHKITETHEAWMWILTTVPGLRGRPSLMALTGDSVHTGLSSFSVALAQSLMATTKSNQQQSFTIEVQHSSRHSECIYIIFYILNNCYAKCYTQLSNDKHKCMLRRLLAISYVLRDLIAIITCHQWPRVSCPRDHLLYLLKQHKYFKPVSSEGVFA